MSAGRVVLGILALVLVASLSGCATAKPVVRKTAAQDFQCDENSVEVKHTDDDRYWQAIGCNKTADYSCRACAFGPYQCKRVSK